MEKGSIVYWFLLWIHLWSFSPLLGWSSSTTTKNVATAFVVTPSRLGAPPQTFWRATASSNDDDDDDDLPPMELPGEETTSTVPTSRAALSQAFTVAQLQQQLRLRGCPVSGRKAILVDRLWKAMGGSEDVEEETPTTRIITPEIVNVTDFVDPKDQGKHVITKPLNAAEEEEEDIVKEDETSKDEPEIWGAPARRMLADDVEDHRVVIDTVTRSYVTFGGSNQTDVAAIVIATREALRHGTTTSLHKNATTPEAMEQRLYDLQRQREAAAKKPWSPIDDEGVDEGDEIGIFDNVLDREVSDWGKYTVAGAQLSAQQAVQGVILLPDVYGMESEDILALAETIAFECQPAIIMIPDIFRGNPWSGPIESMDDYEAWRNCHNELRVSVDIRAAAACLRSTYGVTSIVLWGLCYGGGRALEAASGVYDSVHDLDGTTIGPPPVDPAVVVAWYPTRYKNTPDLFGQTHRGRSKANMAVMGVFAGQDTIPGATAEDAATLKSALGEDDRIVDHMIKVFGGQDHGFAHIGRAAAAQAAQPDPTARFLEEEFGGAGRISIAEGDAEVACLLSTAFMETYSRAFLPTVGNPISLDENEREWGQELAMKDLEKYNDRDIRAEIEEALDNYVEEPLESGPRIAPNDMSQEDAIADMLRSMEDPDTTGELKIEDDDDLETIYAKLTTADKDFQIF